MAGGDRGSLLFRVPESLVNIAHFQKLNELGYRAATPSLPIETHRQGGCLRRVGCALPAPSPAAAPPASPSAATSKESNDEEKQDRTDGSVDDCADHSRTEMDA